MIKLAHRVLLRLHGPDTSSFLQGLITNDVNKLKSTSGIAAFLLNTKGRIIEDVLLWNRGTDDIFLECSNRNKEVLINEITRFRLRKKVEIEQSSESIGFVESENETFNDPRFSKFGSRVFANKIDGPSDIEKYNMLRRKCGIAEGADELEGLLPFQANGDFLNMVSLDKGCYIGQELTARTAHTGVIRRRILTFRNLDAPIEHGADIVDEKMNKVGRIISSGTENSLGILQLSAFNKKLTVAGKVVRTEKPEWMPEKILDNNKSKTSLST